MRYPNRCLPRYSELRVAGAGQPLPAGRKVGPLRTGCRVVRDGNWEAPLRSHDDGRNPGDAQELIAAQPSRGGGKYLSGVLPIDPALPSKRSSEEVPEHGCFVLGARGLGEELEAIDRREGQRIQSKQRR